MEEKTILETIEEKILLGLNEYDTSDVGSKERKEILEETVKLASIRNEMIHEDADVVDKKKRREIEEMRENNAVTIETMKQNIGWRKISLEMAKAIVPLGLQILAYSGLQKRVLKFEETGILKSSASRQFNLPKFWR